jgi:predicted Zn-ribbon and HTH transcriptional regulator
MTNARCMKCGFVLRGRFTKGPPKACPLCGFDKSQEILKNMAKIKIQEKQDVHSKLQKN